MFTHSLEMVSKLCRGSGVITALIIRYLQITNSLISTFLFHHYSYPPAATLTAVMGVDGVIWEHALTIMRVVNSLLAEGGSYWSCISSLACFPSDFRRLPEALERKEVFYFDWMIYFYISELHTVSDRFVWCQAAQEYARLPGSINTLYLSLEIYLPVSVPLWLRLRSLRNIASDSKQVLLWVQCVILLIIIPSLGYFPSHILRDHHLRLAPWRHD